MVTKTRIRILFFVTFTHIYRIKNHKTRKSKNINVKKKRACARFFFTQLFTGNFPFRYAEQKMKIKE